MIKRIVKMEFEEKYVNQFKSIFIKNKNKILSFKGCHSLDLLNDIKENNVFFTFSVWESEKHLNQYRESETFKLIWAKTKPLFNNKAKAWSVEEI